MNNTMVTCTLCHGKGVDPFGIMSRSSTCYVCGGKRQVVIEEPHQAPSVMGVGGIPIPG